MKQTFTTTNSAKTRALGKTFATHFKGGDIVLLEGELGAGKTCLSQGIARALGVKKSITSPTFTLMNIYTLPRAASKRSGIRQLAHIDLYRLKTEAEIYGIGAMDYIGEPTTLALIEWPDKMRHALKVLKKKRAYVRIAFKHTGQTKRRIAVSGLPR